MSTSVSGTLPYASDLSAKFVQALVTGLIKAEFFQDHTITVEYLQQQLFQNNSIPNESQLSLIESFRSALIDCAYNNRSVDELSQHFKDGGLNEQQVEAVATVWKREGKKIHDHLPTAIVQINTKSSLPSFSPSSVSTPSDSSLSISSLSRDSQIQFECDRSSVAGVLGQLEEIERIISAAGTQ